MGQGGKERGTNGPKDEGIKGREEGEGFGARGKGGEG